MTPPPRSTAGNVLEMPSTLLGSLMRARTMPAPPTKVRPQGELGQAPRQRDHDVPRQRRGTAARHQVLIAALEETGRVAQVRIDPEPFAEQHAVEADDQVGIAGRLLQIEERRAAAEGHAEKWPELPLGTRRRRARQQQCQRQDCDSHR